MDEARPATEGADPSETVTKLRRELADLQEHAAEAHIGRAREHHEALEVDPPRAEVDRSAEEG